jgi:site-specific DNA recombinase
MGMDRRQPDSRCHSLVQVQAQARSDRHGKRCYALSGLVRCAACGRRMQGQWNHDVAHYRCRFPSEYGLANQVDHPKTAYIRESAIMPKLDEWLAGLFTPTNLDETVAAMNAAGDVDAASEARAKAARRKLADCDDRLAKYRAALEGGADPVVVAGWMAEVQGERLQAEADLAVSAGSKPRTDAELRELILGLGDMAQVLAEADPADKVIIYTELGVTITYDPIGTAQLLIDSVHSEL